MYSISLRITTETSNQGNRAYADMAQLSVALQTMYPSVQIFADMYDPDDVDETEEYSDADTMMKVFDAMHKTGLITSAQCTEMIKAIQNAGILFREKRNVNVSDYFDPHDQVQGKS